MKTTIKIGDKTIDVLLSGANILLLSGLFIGGMDLESGNSMMQLIGLILTLTGLALNGACLYILL